VQKAAFTLTPKLPHAIPNHPDSSFFRAFFAQRPLEGGRRSTPAKCSDPGGSRAVAV
jgi:hypothetical protein